jgi:hypothetical protein
VFRGSRQFRALVPKWLNLRKVRKTAGLTSKERAVIS